MEGIAQTDQVKVVKAILDATAEITEWLRYHSGKLNILFLIFYRYIYLSLTINYLYYWFISLVKLV